VRQAVKLIANPSIERIDTGPCPHYSSRFVAKSLESAFLVKRISCFQGMFNA
jgi:hypothetical protein